MTIPNDDTTKALHAAVKNAVGGVKTCADAVALAQAVKRLDAPEDLAGAVRSVIHNLATGHEAINGLLSPTDVASLVEAYEMIPLPRSIRVIA